MGSDTCTNRYGDINDMDIHEEGLSTCRYVHVRDRSDKWTQVSSPSVDSHLAPQGRGRGLCGLAPRSAHIWGGGQERTHQVRHCSPEKRRKPAFNSHRATGGRVPHTLALKTRSGMHIRAETPRERTKDAFTSIKPGEGIDCNPTGDVTRQEIRRK